MSDETLTAQFNHKCMVSSSPTNAPQIVKLIEKGKEVEIDVSSLTPYKPLPEGWQKTESYWIYCWPVTEKKLHRMLTQVFGEKRKGTGDMADLIGSTYTVLRLRAYTGYIHLSNFICHADEEAIAARMARGYKDGPAYVRVLMASCTAEKHLFRRRPTEVQMKFLNKLFGEPRWFEDIFSKDEF